MYSCLIFYSGCLLYLFKLSLFCHNKFTCTLILCYRCRCIYFTYPLFSPIMACVSTVLFSIVSTLYYVDSGSLTKGCMVVTWGMIEGGSHGFSFSLWVLVTDFCNSSILTKIGLSQSLACNVYWSNISFKSLSVRGLMFWADRS